MAEKLHGFTEGSARRVVNATLAVEASQVSHTPRPSKSRDTVLLPTGDPRPIILRDIQNDNGVLLLVERAVKHPDFGGDVDLANLGRWIGLSEKLTMELPPPSEGEPDPEPVPAVLIQMATWMHTFARDYRLFVWPEGVPTDKTTDILTAQRVGGDFHVRPDLRLLLRRVQDDARVGSCFPEGAFAD